MPPGIEKGRGLGKPEPFQFLAFTHACATKSTGWFVLRRHTSKKRMRAKAQRGQDRAAQTPAPPDPRPRTLARQRHPRALRLLRRARQRDAINAFRDQATRHCYWALRRRSQRHRLNWERMHRIVVR